MKFNEDNTQEELKELELEHDELNYFIDSSYFEDVDEITIQRFKKRRLFIRDRIKEIKSYPNITA
jgi:hypothetical protein